MCVKKDSQEKTVKLITVPKDAAIMVNALQADVSARMGSSVPTAAKRSAAVIVVE